MDVTELIGKTMVRVENENDERIVFTTTEGDIYALYHSQDCCEYVSVENIAGDLSDLVGSPILLAEEVEYTEEKELPTAYRVQRQIERANSDYYEGESQTWTFYKFATIKGYVDIRWYGSSNGYYSESVDFEKIGEGHVR